MNYFGPAVLSSTPLSAVKQYTKSSSEFLLVNTEVKYDSFMNGFEIYAYKPGPVTIKVIQRAYFKQYDFINFQKIQIKIVSFDFCGQNDSCAYYFSQSLSIGSTVPDAVYSFNLVAGYNNIRLILPALVRKGSMVLLESNQIVAVDPITNSIYSDYFINNGDLYKIDETTNMRFLLNLQTYSTFYYHEISISKSYLYTGEYNISVSLNETTIYRTVEITNGIFLIIFLINIHL